MLEREYQAQLIRQLKRLFPNCIILKNDTRHIQGIPDLTVLYGERWAMLEVKASARAAVQPNQEYYVNALNGMSFAAFIHPGNEEEVLRDLQHLFEPRW